MLIHNELNIVQNCKNAVNGHADKYIQRKAKKAR